MSKLTKENWEWPTRATHSSTSKVKKGKGKKAGWVVELEEDPATGDLICPLPDEMLASLGWKEGDTLDWDFNEKTGQIILRKVS